MVESDVRVVVIPQAEDDALGVLWDLHGVDPSFPAPFALGWVDSAEFQSDPPEGVPDRLVRLLVERVREDEEPCSAWGGDCLVRTGVPYRATGRARVLAKRMEDLRVLLLEVPRDVLNRAKDGKSAFRACKACGSRISIAHLRVPSCPVCGDERFLWRQEEVERIDGLQGRAKRLADRFVREEAVHEAARVTKRVSVIAVGSGRVGGAVASAGAGRSGRS